MADDVSSEKLGIYYIDFEEDFNKLNGLLTSFDPKGIPLIRAYIDVDSDQLHYYPITIGQFALAVFNTYHKTKNQDKRKHFLQIADWFLENKTEDLTLGTYWLTHVPKPEYEVHAPWKSAFAQSRAISVLLRAWQLTSDSKYFDAAASSLQIFTKDISDGGVAIRRPGSHITYEEYVALQPTRVLDGAIFSLFGLFDFVRATKDTGFSSEYSKANILLTEGLEGLRNILPDYDIGYWLQYSLCEVPSYPAFDPCTISYLNLVISQLKILNRVTNDTFWLERAHHFEKYLGMTNILRAYWLKFRALRKLKRL